MIINNINIFYNGKFEKGSVKIENGKIAEIIFGNSFEEGDDYIKINGVKYEKVD